MKRLLLALALALPLFGGQSLELTTGDTMSFTPPDEAPWNALGAWRTEISATITTCSSNTSLFKIGSYHAYCTSGAVVWLATGTDSGSESVSGKTDVLIRIQRDPSQTLASSNGSVATAHLEIWDADGTDRIYQRTNDTGAATFDASSIQSWTVGASDIEFHWMKVYSTLTEVGANAPLPDPHGTGDLADWDFEGDAVDSGPDGMDFSVSGTAFTTSPTLNPVADPTIDADPFWMQQPSVRAGAEITLTADRSISHDDASTLTCVWSDQTGGSGPTAILFTGSTTSCSTKAVFPTFGEYDLRLVVTDDSANTGTANVTVGAVATDSNRIVVMDDDDFAFALGEHIQWGQSAWPFLPERTYKMALDFAAARSTAGWRTKGTGTIAVENGSTAVVGSGTNFQDTYCSGGVTPDDNSKLVITDADGINWLNNISSCNSATSLTLGNNWNKATDSGLEYAFWGTANVFFWINGSENENYYDNVWAYYLLCKTSGLQWACQEAADLAALWWEMPYISEGLAVSGPLGGAGVIAPRLQAMIGLMLWAIDQEIEADIFPGIETSIEFFDYFWAVHPANYCPSDPREAWYVGMWLSLAAELDPDGTRVSNYETILGNAMDASGGVSGGELDPHICRFPDGGWISGGQSIPSAGAGTVSVENGSPTFTCESTCGWDADDVGSYVQIGIMSDRDRRSDLGQYLITAQDPGSLTVSPNFWGTTGAGRYYFIRPVNTYVHQALGNAMPNLALDWQYKNGFSDHRQAMVDTFDYIEDKLYWADKKGLYNLSDEAGCAAAQLAETAEADGNCQYDPTSTASSKRFLSLEIAAAMAKAVKYGRQIDNDNTAARVAFMDTLMGAALGGLGGPNTDTTWAEEYNDNEATFTVGNGKQKNFGFCCGVGGASAWDAERLGGLAAEQLAAFNVPIDIASVVDATKASVTL